MAGVLSIRFACAPPRGKESNNHPIFLSQPTASGGELQGMTVGGA